jgi:GAF domain-containing protein
MNYIDPESAQRLLRTTQGSLRESVTATEYHWELLRGLRSLVGCDGALFRPGSRWVGSQAYYLDADSRFTDGYVNRAEMYRPEVSTWCDLSKGDRAIIDTEVYSTHERRKKALYGEVIQPAKVKSIMGCPLSVGGKPVALVFLYRTGLARPFRDEQAKALDPILKGLAMAEVALSQPMRKLAVQEAMDAMPKSLHTVFELLLTGKNEKEIAADLRLSARTVHKYIENIYRLLRVNSRAELMARMLA